MDEFLYEKELAPCGVAVEMIYGGEEKSAKVWKLFAMQIFSEAEGDYRMIEHLECGAPFLEGVPQRITVSHTPHCLAVASLPKTPDIALDEVNIRTAIGIDIEKKDREQVIKVRERFLTADEAGMLPSIPAPSSASEEDIKTHILAWTCKEALYKAAMGTAKDWKEDYRITKLPRIAANLASATPQLYGKGLIQLPDGNMDMILSSWEFEGHIVTLAISGKIARYQTGAQN